MSSTLYSVVRVCPCARAFLQLERNVFSACQTRFVIVVILCLLRAACVPTYGGEIYGEQGISREAGWESGKYCKTVNVHKLRTYDDARAGAVYMLNPISLSGVRSGGTPLAGCRHVAS